MRKKAKEFKVKQYYKMGKKEIIDAILQKQNSISDTSSNSSGSDTELKIQPKKEQAVQKEENIQPVQKEENFIVYESENTETEEEKENTETIENENIETIENTEDLQKYEKEYVEGIQDVQLLQNIIQYIENLPRTFFQRKRNVIKQQYETDLQTLLTKPKKSTRQPPKKKTMFVIILMTLIIVQKKHLDINILRVKQKNY